MPKFVRLVLASALLLALALALADSAAHAAPVDLPILIVNSTADTNTADSALTFREADLIANGGTGAGGVNRVLTDAEKAQTSGCTFSGSTDNWSITGGCGGGVALSIYFKIPGSQLHIIKPLSQLPGLPNGVIINGYSQPGSVVNTKNRGFNGVLKIELLGTKGGNIQGLSLSNDSIVTGLILNGFQGTALTLGSHNSIVGNFIGINPFDGRTKGNQNYGITIFGSNNTIGGSDGVTRNFISGNTTGIALAGSGATTNTIQGNYIGLDATGTAALGSQANGIYFFQSTSNLIGGPNRGEGNLISGNSNGIFLASGADNNIIQGNRIGTDASGKQAVPNFVGIASDANFTLIGPTLVVSHAGAPVAATPGGNLIAFNKIGVAVNGSALYNQIRQNRIWNNTQLGIDLNNDGPTPNDLGTPPDTDTGPNGLQNFPTIKSAKASTRVIKGELYSTPNSYFWLDIFSNPTCSSNGYGQGKKYLDTVLVHTDANGHATFQLTPAVAFVAGEQIAATASDTNGNTSEFGKCKLAK